MVKGLCSKIEDSELQRKDVTIMKSCNLRLSPDFSCLFCEWVWKKRAGENPGVWCANQIGVHTKKGIDLSINNTK